MKWRLRETRARREIEIASARNGVGGDRENGGLGAGAIGRGDVYSKRPARPSVPRERWGVGRGVSFFSLLFFVPFPGE